MFTRVGPGILMFHTSVSTCWLSSPAGRRPNPTDPDRLFFFAFFLFHSLTSFPPEKKVRMTTRATTTTEREFLLMKGVTCNQDSLGQGPGMLGSSILLQTEKALMSAAPVLVKRIAAMSFTVESACT